MRIKITQSKGNRPVWYSKRVGEIFPVLEEKRYWYVVNFDGLPKTITKDNCTVMEDTIKQSEWMHRIGGDLNEVYGAAGQSSPCPKGGFKMEESYHTDPIAEMAREFLRLKLIELWYKKRGVWEQSRQEVILIARYFGFDKLADEFTNDLI